MSKPIFIIKKNLDLYSSNEYNKIAAELGDKMQDYHVLLIHSFKPEVEFQAFYEKDFDEIKYEELKKIVQDSFK